MVIALFLQESILVAFQALPNNNFKHLINIIHAFLINQNLILIHNLLVFHFIFTINYNIITVYLIYLI